MFALDLLRLLQSGKRLIISGDGGGMRGLITIAMLAYLERIFGQPVQNWIAMAGGTSTGAIIAAGIGLGLSANEIMEKVYLNGLPMGFKTNPILNLVLSRGNHLYPLEPFFESLKFLSRGKKMHNLRGIVLMVARDARTNGTIYFVNKGPGAELVKNTPVSGAVAASGAAPVFFPSVAGNLMDGGVGNEGNPCLATTIEAMEYIGQSEGFFDNNVVHISFGTGYVPDIKENGQFGRMNVVQQALYTLTAGLHDAAISQVTTTAKLYGNRIDFRRVNPSLDNESVRNILGVRIHPEINTKTLGLDSHSTKELDLMQAIGEGYAREIPWDKVGYMPWIVGGKDHGEAHDGGHSLPKVLSIDWSKTIYR